MTLKGLALTASMTEALERRDTPALTACLAAQLGALALKIVYERWSHTLSDSDFGELARRTLRNCRRPARGFEAYGLRDAASDCARGAQQPDWPSRTHLPPSAGFAAQ